MTKLAFGDRIVGVISSGDVKQLRPTIIKEATTSIDSIEKSFEGAH